MERQLADGVGGCTIRQAVVPSPLFDSFCKLRPPFTHVFPRGGKVINQNPVAHEACYPIRTCSFRLIFVEMFQMNAVTKSRAQFLLPEFSSEEPDCIGRLPFIASNRNHEVNIAFEVVRTPSAGTVQPHLRNWLVGLAPRDKRRVPLCRKLAHRRFRLFALSVTSDVRRALPTPLQRQRELPLACRPQR